MCALLESLYMWKVRDEMIVLGRVLYTVACILMLLVMCNAPATVEYIRSTSCSYDQFYQISNLSCVDCATNQVKSNNGICLLFKRLFCRCVFIGINFVYLLPLLGNYRACLLITWDTYKYTLLQDGLACSAVMAMMQLQDHAFLAAVGKNMVRNCIVLQV